MSTSIEDYATIVVEPNISDLRAAPDDLRIAVNTFSALDAFVGILAFHRHGQSSKDQDSNLRKAIAKVSPAYQTVRDASFAVKHGYLTQRPPRIVDKWFAVHLASAVWHDDSFWDDDLAITDEIVCVEYADAALPTCRADVLAVEAWAACKAEWWGYQHAHQAIVDLARRGVFGA